MKNLFHLISILLCLHYVSCTPPGYEKVVPLPEPDPSKQPPAEIYNRDCKQISQTWIKIQEYYRLAYLEGRMDSVYQDPLNVFYNYHYRTTSNRDIAITNPIATQFKVTVDTLRYNRNMTLCYALIIIKACNDCAIGLMNCGNCSQDAYSGEAVIGLRNHIDEPFKIYPVTHLHFYDMAIYDLISMDMRYYHFKIYGVGDPDFFEKSSYFEKFDDTRYEFQMYKDHGVYYEINYVEAKTDVID